jgi:hypothetical protein
MTRLLPLFILAAFLSVPMFAADCPTPSTVITSTVTGGNASDAATWGGSSLGTGDGKCLIVQGPVVLDRDLGTRGNTGVYTIFQSGSGSLSINSTAARHIYFASTGTDPVGSGSYFGPGPEANMYGFFFPAGTLALTATQANPVVINSADGIHPWYIAGANTETQSFSLAIQWCDCSNLGVNASGYYGASVDTTSFSGAEMIDIENSRFTSPYEALSVFASRLGPGQLKFLNNIITGRRGPATLQATELVNPAIQGNTESAPAAAGWFASVGEMSGASIAYTQNAVAGTATTGIGNLVINAALSGAGVIEDNLSYNDPAQAGAVISSGIDITQTAVFTGPIDSNYCETCDEAIAVRGTSTAAAVTITNNFAVTNHLAAVGQGIYFISGGSVTLTGNTGVFTDSNSESNAETCIFGFSPRTALTATNNTCESIAGPATYSFGIDIGEPGYPVSYALVDSNVISGFDYGVRDGDSHNQYAHLYAGAGVYRNDVWNSAIAYQSDGSPGFDNGSQPHPNALYGDVTANPNFSDTARVSLAAYDSRVLGGPGTVADVISQLGYRSGWGGTYRLGASPVADALTWFRAGFAPAAALTLSPATLPPAVVGSTYSQILTVSGGSGCTFSVTGALPPGLTLSVTGMLTGIPSAIGTYTFAIGAICFDGSIQASKTIQVTSPPKQIDITSMVQFKQSAILYGRTTDLGSVTITNTGSKWIAAPIQFVLDNLISSATLTDQDGTDPTGAPYITAGRTAPLPPGGSVMIILEFSNPSRTPISYVPKALSGKF